MDILLGWSKKRSRDMADVLHRWLPKVLPGVEPWMSEKDIDKGKEWWAELKGFLGEASGCVISVTRENVRSPWLYYESGRIAGNGEHVLICPYLIGVGPSSLIGTPLAQYQCTEATKEDTLRLVKSLNKALDESKRHHEDVLTGHFESKWPEFETELGRILAMDVGDAEELVATDADDLAGMNLSSEARTLLIEASKDKHGIVIKMRSSSGLTVQTNEQNLCPEPHNPRVEAPWSQAVEDLETAGLLEATSWKREAFRLTAQGFKVADLLKN